MIGAAAALVAGAACRAQPGAAGPDTTALRDSVERIVRELGLDAGLRRECYALDADLTRPTVSATVREVHDARCGGDLHTAPRVSSMDWDPRTGVLVTDFWGLPQGRVDTLPREGRTEAARRLATQARRAAQ